ncbi:serine hydrolase [Micromonospora sp. DT81.3]|uniref:serine hydrolase n=1 Tax=Micromonospora sp. DT81.3 TaxID=3416523 RepID=UPI003CF4B266
MTGHRFSDYMQEVILDPLGMTDSTFDPDRVSVQATGYYPNGNPLPHYRLTEQAAGGLYSTASDLALLLAASMSSSDGRVAGRGVLTSESVRTMMAERDMPDGNVVSFGHLPEHLDGGLAGTGNNGHTEGWIANMVMIPELGEGIVVLTNSDTESTGLTLRAWTQWLGVSETFTTQIADGALDQGRTLLLGGAAVVFIGVLVVIIVTAVQARRGNRRWLWQTGQTTSRQFAVRGIFTALAIGGLIAFLIWPERQVYVAVMPEEAATVLVAAVLAVAAVVLGASTRRVSK